MAIKKKLLILVILLTACFFRFQNLNWDNGFHLHPDERFLTMVGVAMKMPSSLLNYLNPGDSPMNPANIGYGFFVYGVFPVVATKLLALLFLADNYHAFTIMGRLVTAFLDLGIVLFVYRATAILEKEKIVSSKLKYWASFFYATAVLPIQYAHFFTTDTFLNFFVFGSFVFSLSSYRKTSAVTVAGSALFFGLAVASKINAVLILPLLFFLLLSRPLGKKQWMEAVYISFFFLVLAYAVLRVAAPYYFESADPFSLAPNELFVKNLLTLKSFEGKNVQYPPALQWINTMPFVFPVINMALFGLGLPVFLLFAIGLVQLVRYAGKHIRHSRGRIAAAIFGWAVAVFLYESVQFVKVMRYFLFLYPFFSVLVGWGAETVLAKIGHGGKAAVLVAVCLIWPLVFSSIYFVANTRVEANGWIYTHIPDNATILGEYWDDPLPITVQYPPPRSYRGDQLTVFDPDTPQKWEKINNQLQAGDYYILSSNRGWGTLPSVPQRFPQTTQFYHDLFNGKLGYALVKSFYPVYYPCRIFSFTCPRIMSNWFDESFTVYDHPTVFIFKNIRK